MRKWEELLLRFRVWLGHTPSHSSGLLKCGVLALQRRDYGNAHWYFLKALESAYAHLPSYVQVGVAVHEQRFPPLYPIGLEALRRALALAPFHPLLQTQQGVLLAVSGRLEEAQRAFEQVLIFDGDNVDARVNLGNILHQRHRPLDALQQLQVAVQLAPGHFEANLKLGLVSQDLGYLVEAKRFLVQALKLRPERLELLIPLAHNATFQGDLDRAEQILRHFLRSTETRDPKTWSHWRRLAEQLLLPEAPVETRDTFFQPSQSSRSLHSVPSLVMRKRITNEQRAVPIKWQPSPLTRGKTRPLFQTRVDSAHPTFVNSSASSQQHMQLHPTRVDRARPTHEYHTARERQTATVG